MFPPFARKRIEDSRGEITKHGELVGFFGVPIHPYREDKKQQDP